MKNYFVEINEVIEGVNNKSFKIKFIRLFIRYLTRFVGFNNASLFLSWLVFLAKKTSNTHYHNYFLYIIQINIFRNNCLGFLKKKELTKHQIEKRKWSNFIMQYSKSNTAINNAKDYLKLFYDYDKYQFKLSSNQKKTNKNLYFYGPKAEKLLPYHDCVIVLTKPISEDISKYKGSILFLNSLYYNNMVSHNYDFQEDLLKKYDEIYVSIVDVNVREGFIKINPLNENNSGYLASPMALGRIFNYLLKNYSIESFIVEGYDCYLSSEVYNSRYPSTFRSSNGNFKEKAICWGLAHHDPFYNFLYLKKACENVKLIKSQAFHNIIKMSGDDYMKKLFNTRNFSKL